MKDSCSHANRLRGGMHPHRDPFRADDRCRHAKVAPGARGALCGNFLAGSERLLTLLDWHADSHVHSRVRMRRASAEASLVPQEARSCGRAHALSRIA